MNDNLGVTEHWHATAKGPRGRKPVFIAKLPSPLCSPDVLRSIVLSGLARLIAKRLILAGVTPHQLKDSRKNSAPSKGRKEKLK